MNFATTVMQNNIMRYSIVSFQQIAVGAVRHVYYKRIYRSYHIVDWSAITYFVERTTSTVIVLPVMQ